MGVSTSDMAVVMMLCGCSSTSAVESPTCLPVPSPGRGLACSHYISSSICMSVAEVGLKLVSAQFATLAPSGCIS